MTAEDNVQGFVLAVSWDGTKAEATGVSTTGTATDAANADFKAPEIFPDGYFDCVFIDTTHTYEQTKAEIIAWEPKVRKGGLLTGHDYGSRRPSHRGVSRAVDEIYGKRAKIYPHMVFVVEV